MNFDSRNNGVVWPLEFGGVSKSRQATGRRDEQRRQGWAKKGLQEAIEDDAAVEKGGEPNQVNGDEATMGRVMMRGLRCRDVMCCEGGKAAS
ncbi:hypothetical protein O9K51_01822 [Purpureocillium lavendulum]|uniref:Uncharacterized protein n=1 Tax=Purpureocillium lavendulum TaxID=1247861 RepID=A0AB34G8F9_9HYPO|nr:hypothetical protein O9K51_01822 [Purpureocillium lavendulum]